MQFSRLKLALTNLLPTDALEIFKYQILVDHVKLEEACLIANSFYQLAPALHRHYGSLDWKVWPAAPCRFEEDRCDRC